MTSAIAIASGDVVIALPDAAATRLSILAALEELAHEIKSTDTFLFYIASHGALVYALKEALSGKAATDPGGTVSALALGEYVSRRVGELARAQNHDQEAQLKAAQSALRSFPIGKVSK